MIKNLLKKFKQEGASLVEYALLLSLVALASIAILTLLGGTVSTKFTSVNTALSS